MSRNTIDIAFGYAQGYKAFQSFGWSDIVDDTEHKVIGPGLGAISNTASGGANRLHLLDTSGTLTVKRANPADTGKVAVRYLDTAWRERAAVFDLAAAATATTDVLGQTITARRCVAVDYINGGNLGYVDALIGGDLANRVSTGDGLSRVAMYTTPKGQRTAMTGFGLAAQATRAVDLLLWYKEPGRLPKVLERFPARESLEVWALPVPRLIQSADLSAFPTVTPITEGIDIFVTARRPVGSGSTADVSVYIGLLAQVNAGDPDAPGFTVY